MDDRPSSLWQQSSERSYVKGGFRGGMRDGDGFGRGSSSYQNEGFGRGDSSMNNNYDRPDFQQNDRGRGGNFPSRGRG
jgi:hypothetical protein